MADKLVVAHLREAGVKPTSQREHKSVAPDCRQKARMTSDWVESAERRGGNGTFGVLLLKVPEHHPVTPITRHGVCVCVRHGQLQCAACHSSLSCSFCHSLGAISPRDGRGRGSRAPCHGQLSFATDRGELEPPGPAHRPLISPQEQEGRRKQKHKWGVNEVLLVRGEEWEGLSGVNCCLKVSSFFLCTFFLSPLFLMFCNGVEGRGFFLIELCLSSQGLLHFDWHSSQQQVSKS